MYLVTAQEMRDLESYTINQLGIPGHVLMESAGRAVVDQIVKRFPNPKRVVVLAGTGNNGGDGFVVARWLAFRGWEVDLWLIGSAVKLTSDAKLYYHACEQLLSIHHAEKESEASLQAHLMMCDVIVDAMLGIGYSGMLREPFTSIVQWINQHAESYIFAVDMPTGVEADKGHVFPVALRVDETITFNCPKWGHYLLPGSKYCGKLKVVDIGITPAGHTKALTPNARLNDPNDWNMYLGGRKQWAHKGTYGHVLIIGGAKGTLGAVAMAGEAAYRMGSGLVTLTVPESQHEALAAKVTQEMIWSWPGKDHFLPEIAEELKTAFQRYDAVVCGPGLGRFPGEVRFIKEILQTVKRPLVLDADALNILAEHPHLMQFRANDCPTILTPHPGEMARLLRITTEEVERKRAAVALQLAYQTRSVVILKGRYTIIAFPDGKRVVNTTGSPALAKAGSGDILSGIIGSLLAQEIPVESAIQIAVYIHGRLGEEVDAHSALYRDLLDHIASIRQLLEPTNSPGN
ncbi:NAD(P)H-hydrate dehydratase [Hazenella sp. IB182357]|uniref:Bifunctional NAD(P)H-hydrate repair enzyme n=1 Tax=Polycladospora coralii TaxID=2771432 RepID=A0A926N9I3_9BACL|nr:NAD(P)H-hydrate dehydratase [Polycladospora coralii]